MRIKDLSTIPFWIECSPKEDCKDVHCSREYSRRDKKTAELILTRQVHFAPCKRVKTKKEGKKR